MNKKQLTATFKKMNTAQIAVALIVVVILGLAVNKFVVFPLRVQAEKQQFENAQKELIVLADEIQAKVGQADKVTTEQSCSRPNLKFAEGSLSCQTSQRLIYSVTDFNEANDIIKTISEEQDSTIFALSLESASQNKFSNSEGTQRLGQTINSIESDLDCNIIYSLENSQDTLTVSFRCATSSLAEHFETK